jgi:hypothetical protein
MTSDTRQRILDALAEAQLTFTTEDDLQAQLLRVLLEAGLDAVREVRLSDGRSRIDLLVADVGIEVKTNGSWSDVARQLTRYAHCDEISSLVLVTSRAKHHSIPRELAGTPIDLVSLIGAGL